MSGSGTQSPPLEATGEHKPMGAGSVNAVFEGKGKVEAVPDSEQRKTYFENSDKSQATKDRTDEKST